MSKSDLRPRLMETPAGDRKGQAALNNVPRPTKSSSSVHLSSEDLREKWSRRGAVAAIEYAHPSWPGLTSKSQCVEIQR